MLIFNFPIKGGVPAKTRNHNRNHAVALKAEPPGPASKATRDLPGLGSFYSSREVMELLGYKDSTTFFQAVRRIGLPYVRITRSKTVFRADDLNAWMASRTVGAPKRFST